MSTLTVESTRFGTIEIPESDVIEWLALPVTDPSAFVAGYEVELSDEDTDRLGADPTSVWVTVRTGAALPDFSVNLRAPIVIANGRGFQMINEAPEAPVRAPLFPGVPAEQAA
jgi:flagellar assembly factor FliW